MSNPIEFNKISDYVNRSYFYYRLFEGHEPLPYDDGKGFLTIGVGFNIDGSRQKDVLAAVLEEMNVFSLSNSVEKKFREDNELPVETYQQMKERHFAIVEQFQQIILNYPTDIENKSVTESIVREKLNQKLVEITGVEGKVFSLSGSESKSVYSNLLKGIGWGRDFESGYTHSFKGFAELLRDRLDLNVPDIENTNEFAVLISMAFNSGLAGKSVIGDILVNSIRTGDRARAWYEIRYNSNSYKETKKWTVGLPDGTAKRRFVEAEYFSLFTSPYNPTRQETIDLFQMLSEPEPFSTDFNTLRDKIIAYEARFGELSGENNRDMVAVANDEYSDHVGTLTQNLAPAKNKLLEEFGPQIFDDVSSNDYQFHVLNIQILKDDVSDVVGLHIDSALNNGDGVLSDNLVVGNALNNRIEGLSGDDILWGLDGSDIINGGEGNDVLVGGRDNDTLSGGVGKNYLYGGEGNDHLYAQSESSLSDLDADYLFGEEGDDSLYAAAGMTVMTGGLGLDTYFIDLGTGTNFISFDANLSLNSDNKCNTHG